MAEGKIIAVWGSPNSGKTTFATKLATSIYESKNIFLSIHIQYKVKIKKCSCDLKKF